MVAKKLVEACQSVSVTTVVVAIVVAILALIKTILLPHEAVGVLSDFVTNFRMLLQIILQRGMSRQELLVVEERWILAHLLGDFGMAIEEVIHARQLPSSSI